MAETFDELGPPSKTGARCSRCGQPATHGIVVQVRPVGQGSGLRPVIARAKSRMCERCAVSVFEAMAKALR